MTATGSAIELVCLRMCHDYCCICVCNRFCVEGKKEKTVVLSHGTLFFTTDKIKNKNKTKKNRIQKAKGL